MSNFIYSSVSSNEYVTMVLNFDFEHDDGRKLHGFGEYMRVISNNDDIVSEKWVLTTYACLYPHVMGLADSVDFSHTLCAIAFTSEELAKEAAELIFKLQDDANGSLNPLVYLEDMDSGLEFIYYHGRKFGYCVDCTQGKLMFCDIDNDHIYKALITFYAVSKREISSTVLFYQEPLMVAVLRDITGLPPEL